MGGLDYLNKKVWHPGSMKNIQKVWEEEQKQKEINKKARQRAKKLQQQRHNEDLKRIQVQAGLIPKSHMQRMEWLYDWGNKVQKQKTNEEFLTGKKTADPTSRKQFKGTFQEQITNAKCQDFALLYEDPMFQIQKRQKEKRDALMNNPIQMKQIIKEVERDYLSTQLRSSHSSKKLHKKKHKKQKKQKKQKKDKKHKKHKSSHKSSRSRDSSGQQRNSQSSDRERSRDKRNKHKRYRSSSSSSSSSSHKNSEKKSSVSSKSRLLQQYKKERFAGMLSRREDGSLQVDYGLHKKKYKTQYQLDQDQRRKKLDQMRSNAAIMKEDRDRQYSRKRHDRESYQSEREDFEHGVNNIRQQMYSDVKPNRNLKRDAKNSDSE